MLGSKQFSNADAGTIYLLSEDEKRLVFEVVHTDTLNIKMGGTGEALNWPDLHLYNDEDKPNTQMVAVMCAIKDKLLNFPDVYDAKGFNFEGTKVFDSSTGYRSTSMLVVPMRDRSLKVIGVLQLLNKKDKYNNITAFGKQDEILISSMASLGAVSIQNNKLIKSLEDLLEAFIKTIADTLEEKSIYTEHHILRVAKLVNIITKTINKDNKYFKDKHFSQDELKELNMAALLHDIGKMVTPESVVDKATRLETITDSIDLVIARFEILKKDIKIKYLENSACNKDKKKLKRLTRQFDKTINIIDEDKQFIIYCNTASILKDEDIKRVNKIAKYKILLNDKKTNILTTDEILNLSIKRGTITTKEREIINNHVVVSYHMLKNLPFPKKYQNIPNIAGSHHKSVDGKHGYAAKELMGTPLNFKEKILAIADVFESLTSPERPYKKPFTLNKSFKIIADMVKCGHLDKEIVQFILDTKLYLDFAKDFLNKDQVDEVKIEL